MTKIQIIIDDGTSLKGMTCNSISMENFEPEKPWERPRFGSYQFIARDIMFDESPNLISIPDELLLRIRDYNIDVERKYAIEQALKLKEEIESLKDQVRGWELRRDLTIEEYQEYRNEINKMVDEHPDIVAEVLYRDGNIKAAEYFAQKANEEENENE